VLSAVLSYACSYDWLPGNVVKMTKKLKEKARERSPSGIEMQIEAAAIKTASSSRKQQGSANRSENSTAATGSKGEALGSHNH
jgi:hypothetical protein